jgi:Domain of unknown function (DUF3291)
MADTADTRFHLAQLNVARLAAPIDSPQLADFMALLDPINQLAEQSPGFVWRYTSPGRNDATGDRIDGSDDELLNLSVWESVDALREFVYRSRHLDVMRRRREWFQSHARGYLVLWWVPAGHRPTVAEALERLAELERNGPGPRAFTFHRAFDSAGEPVGEGAAASLHAAR